MLARSTIWRWLRDPMEHTMETVGGHGYRSWALAPENGRALVLREYSWLGYSNQHVHVGRLESY